MQHISRIYIGNYGHKMCWYDGLVLSLTDKDSGLPCDHIVHLENGGGKSTLLGGIFSCFEPRQDRFLKTLHDPRNKFFEYFRDDGAPGFIIVEWQGRHESGHSSSSSSSSRRIITGQAVAIKNTLTKELERIFFHFETAEDLSLESMPLPKISEHPVSNIRDFSSWLQKMQSRHRGNLFVTRNQNEWERNVEAERGIDIGLLKQQLEFSRQEGAVDAFLNFKTEAEFLRKMLGLTMDQERAMSIRDSIALACDRLRDKPKHEERLKVLSDCEKVLVDFAESARVFDAARSEYSQSQKSSMQLAMSLELRLSKKKKERDERLSALSAMELEQIQTNAGQKELQDKLKGAQFEHHRRLLDEAKAVHECAQKEVTQAEAQIDLHKAARSYRQILAQEHHLQELLGLNEKARQELAPFAAEAKRAGAILKAMLKINIESLKQREGALKLQIAQDRERLQALEKELGSINEERTQLEKELSKLEALDEAHTRGREHLLKQEIIAAMDEPLQSARQRVEVEHLSITNQVEEKNRDIEARSFKLDELRKELERINVGIASSRQILEQKEQALALGENFRSELSNDPILCEIAQSDLVDPEAETLTELISSAKLKLRQEADAHAVTLAKLNSFISEFQSTGLAGANPDVAKVIRRLAEGGVRSAVAFNEYIAEVIPDTNEALCLIGSNPSRFLSVGIQDQTEMELVRKILPVKADISQPVMVSATTQKPDGEKNSQFLVVHPQIDSAFNYKAAEKYERELSEAIAGEEMQRKHCLDWLEKTSAVESRRCQYIEQFGHGRLAEIGASVAGLINDIDAANNRLRQHEKDIESLKNEDARDKSALKALSDTAMQIALDRRELEDFAIRIEAPFLKKRSELENARSSIDDLISLKQEKEAIKSNLARSIEDNLVLSERLSNEAAGAISESNEVSHAHDDFDAIEHVKNTNTTLESARCLYRDQKRIFEAEESLRLGVLGTKIETIREGLATARNAFAGEFGHIDQEAVAFTESEYTDLEKTLSEYSSKLAALKEDMQRARDEWKLSDSKHKEFKRANPDAEVFSRPYREIEEHRELLSILEPLDKDLAACSQILAEFERLIPEIKAEAGELNHYVEMAESSHRQLIGFIDNYQSMEIVDAADFGIEIDDSLLPAQPKEISATIQVSVDAIKKLAKTKEAALKAADENFRAVQAFARLPQVVEAESALSSYLSINDFEDSIANAGELRNAVRQRIDAVESVLATLNKDFEESLEELVNLVAEGLHVLSAACAKRLPENAPYIAGKPVLKMRSSFPPSHAEARRQVLSNYMNSVIVSGFPHKNGTDMVADAILQIANGSLGLQIVKLIRDPSEQYVPVNKLSNSGGEAVSMAMFLYLLIARLRADMQAKVRQGVGGPLILDNPFAKATSSFIWRAQRDLARSLGVQLIIATALPDYNALGEFDHFIRLRKAGQNNKTGRWHIEQADFSFVN